MILYIAWIGYLFLESFDLPWLNFGFSTVY